MAPGAVGCPEGAAVGPEPTIRKERDPAPEPAITRRRAELQPGGSAAEADRSAGRGLGAPRGRTISVENDGSGASVRSNGLGTRIRQMRQMRRIAPSGAGLLTPRAGTNSFETTSGWRRRSKPARGCFHTVQRRPGRDAKWCPASSTRSEPPRSAAPCPRSSALTLFPPSRRGSQAPPRRAPPCRSACLCRRSRLCVVRVHAFDSASPTQRSATVARHGTGLTGRSPRAPPPPRSRRNSPATRGRRAAPRSPRGRTGLRPAATRRPKPRPAP